MSGVPIRARAAVLAALLATAGTAHAGRACEHTMPTPDTIARALDLAQQTAERLDASGAQVVVLARAGQNLDEYHVRYSHLGFAYRDAVGWKVVHKLNECGTAHAAVYRQGLGDFFLDDLYRYEAAVVVPTPEVQAALRPAMDDDGRLAQLNTPGYSMVASPWAQRYQQSNQWAIETLAMTQTPDASTRERAQAWLRLRGYQPTHLHLSAWTRLGARLTAANIAFDDHPASELDAGQVDTVTVDSVFDWLAASGLGGAVEVIRPPADRPGASRP